jgi:tetratricopeptide (TPR) repeat protein
MNSDPEKIYQDGYSAFDRGEYPRAINLATQCLKTADAGSYWYAGALGLRCWAANFAGDYDSVVIDAHTLLTLDTGDEKMWFDGLAVLNLALIRRRVGDVGQAERLFDQARAKYQAYRVNPKKPEDWPLVRQLFEAITHWAASGETDKLDDLAGILSVRSDPNGEIEQLKKAVDLYQRCARGEDVTAESGKVADEGVSRAFLALLLIL